MKARPTPTWSRATRCTSPFLTARSTGSSALRCWSTFPTTLTRCASSPASCAVGERWPITVPRFAPELINWALSDEYHNVPGGHIRIYRRRVLTERLTSTGLIETGSPLRPRTPQSLLVAQVLCRHDQRRSSGREALPSPAGLGHHEEASPHSLRRSRALPAHGQVHRRLPEEAVSAATGTLGGVPDVLSAEQLAATASHLARLQRPNGLIPVVRRGPQRSVESRRSGDGAHGHRIPR